MNTTGVTVFVSGEEDLTVFLGESGYTVTEAGQDEGTLAFKIGAEDRHGEIFLSVHQDDQEDLTELFFQIIIAAEDELSFADAAAELTFKDRLLELATYLDGVAVGRDTQTFDDKVMIVATEKRRADGLDDFEIVYILEALWDAQEAILTLIDEYA
jgi:hypothetical protein